MHRVTPLLFTILFTTTAFAQRPASRHEEGLHQNAPRVFAVTDARIVVSPDRTIAKGTLVVRDGKIAAVGADVGVPAEARVFRGEGKTVYAGFIDAYTEQATPLSADDTKIGYWNKRIRPQLNVHDVFTLDPKLHATLRGQGVAARLVAPSDGIIKGKSALVLLQDDDDKLQQAVLKSDVAQHLELTISRRNRKEYPNSPMGAVALARQAMYDAAWYGRSWAAANRNPKLPRPEANLSLTALASVLARRTPVIAETSNEQFFLRANRFAREFKLNLIVHGSGNEYRRLDAIAATRRDVILPVNFPQPPNVATAESALNVSLESLMHWDIAPENPARLHAAGVRFAFCSHGLKEQKSFLKQIRAAVERGLPTSAALAALTTAPAAMFNVNGQLGTLEPGKIANLVIVDGDVFQKKTKILETWVAGRRHEVTKNPERNFDGVWALAAEKKMNGIDKLRLTVTEKDGKFSGEIAVTDNEGKQESIKLSQFGVKDTRVSGVFGGELLQQSGVVRLTLNVDSKGDATGTLVLADGKRVAVTAGRGDLPPPAKAETPQSKEAQKADYAVNFPLGAYGVEQRPPQPRAVLFRNATVWTSGPAGTLKEASVLIGNGRVLAVGSDLKAPPNAIEVDATGMHLTPGIIDCHSHMATDGGINESAQAVTAEVRIGDFIDCDDINIYRQLAGGVTSSNILHGSANPIGGQNQVIKLRWGALSEVMKFADAPEGVKFALGENVKQSNWGDDYKSRYPQTRMGVEQLFRDEFQAAKEYRQRWNTWKQTNRGLPPRVDLEMEAVAEILEGKRWIHCHSYRQDEILALIRVLDDFKITIGTFQHILEGYKVADAMKKHGAMGSAFSDWWAYKFEVYDAIPFAGALMHNAGVVVSFNSDDAELGRHLNQEAAKAVKYGGVDPHEALKFVTLNPAKQLRIDRHVGSIEVGKHADIVLWNAPPLSNFARCEQTWIDGRKYFDRNDDLKRRKQHREMRNKLVQKILASGEKMRPEGAGDGDPAALWPRSDVYCHGHISRKSNRN